jgi:hypothetical protein
MRILKPLLAILFFLASLGYSQTQTVQNPDCTQNFALNGSNLNSPNFPNSVPNCQTWTVTVYNVGFSGFTLTFQDAPPATTTTPGAYVTYAGTTNTGSNPLTAPGTATFSNGTVAIGWVRVHLSGLTGSGTIYGVIQGWNSANSGGGGGGGGGCTAPCVVIGNAANGAPPSGAPVLIAGSDGTDVRTLKTDSSGDLVISGTVSSACASNAPIGFASNLLVQFIGASAGKSITICHISLGFTTAVNLQLLYGTGSLCGTGTTAVSQPYDSISGIALDVPFTLPSGQAFCGTLSATGTGGGLIVYTQQ